MKTKLQNIYSNDGAFHDGNPATGTLGTVVTAKWLNDVQEITQDYFEEAKNVLALAGITPNPTKSNQIADAIVRYVKQKTNTKVNLTGNETISGEKTFVNRLKAHNGIQIGYTDILVGQGHYGEMFADANTTWLNFKNHVFRWHADGGFSSDNNPFLMSKPLGTSDLNAVNVVGVYGQNANVNATTARHYPANEAGSLQVLPSAYGVMQIYTTFGTKKSYIRNQASGGSWENTWTRVDIGAIARATTVQQGLTQLTNDTGLDSETLALSAKAGKALSQQISQVQQNQANYLLKNKKSSVVNSTSEETIATSKAVKTAYDKAEEAKRLAQSKQSPQTTLSGYGITDAVKQLDMRGTHNQVKFDDASPAQLPQGSFVGLSEKAALESRTAHGWKFISKGWGDQSGAYSCIRLGITDNRFYFQTARDWNNWNAPFEIHHSGLGYLSTTTSNYGGINIERPDRNDKMLMESNNNQFAFIRRNRGNGQNHYAILLPERSGTAMLSGDVAVLTGTIAHGGTIPLPAGFTEAQCKWFVSINNSNRDNAMWDIKEDGGHNHFRLECWTSGRTVHARQLRHDSGRQNYHNMTANYLIIGVK